jgi:hypothetical protein
MTETRRTAAVYRALLLALLLVLAWAGVTATAGGSAPAGSGQPPQHTPSTLEVRAQLGSTTGTQR